MMELHILFVEDNEEDYELIYRQISDYFEARDDINAYIDGKRSFEDALGAIRNPHIRYDLIISDTYKGDHKNSDAAVLNLVDDYRSNDKFCPLIVCSSGVCPSDLEASAFINWVEKTKPDDLDQALKDILDIGIPQLARSLHDDIDSIAGNYLWGFLEKNWESLHSEFGSKPESLQRLIRSRAAIVLNDLSEGENSSAAITNRHGLEYYIYPRLDNDYHSMGDILKNNDDADDIRVILTPHCHLYMHQEQQTPRAEHVLTVRTVSAKDVLGEKLENTKKNGNKQKRLEKLSKWARSPSQTERKPEGRHWYLPHFLDVPHLFCDFLQIESLEYQNLIDNYTCIATITPPYAEAMQQSFASFYGSVGIPDIEPQSITDMLDL